MAIGNRNTYLTDASTPNYIGDALQLNEENLFRARQEKRLDDDKKKAEADKKAEKDAADVDLKGIYTGYNSPDAVMFGAIEKLKVGLADKQRERDAGKISPLDYNIYKNNALSQIDYLKASNERINTQGVEFSKQLAEGKIYNAAADDALTFGHMYDNGNMDVQANPDGTLTVIGYKKNEDGSMSIVEKSPLKDFGRNAFTPVANVDIDADIQQFKATNPADSKETLGYVTKTGYKGLSPRIEKVIETKVDAMLAEPNTRAIAAHQATGKFSREVNDPETIQKAREYLIKRYEGAYASEQTIDEATGRAHLNLAVRKAKKEDEKKPTFVPIRTKDIAFIEDVLKKPVNGPNGEAVWEDDKGTYYKTKAGLAFTYDEDGEKVYHKERAGVRKTTNYKVNTKNILPGSFSFPKGLEMKNAGGEKTGLDNLSIETVSLDNQGNIIFTASVLNSKGQVVKNGGKDAETTDTTTYASSYGKTTRIASGRSAGIIADAMGLSSDEELREVLLQRSGQEGEDAQPQQQVDEYGVPINN